MGKLLLSATDPKPFDDYLSALVTAIAGSECEIDGAPQPLHRGIASVIGEMNAMRARGGTCWLFGNGGSATIADHVAGDMMTMCGWRAVALTNAAMITSLANDHGYESVFARQVQALARDGDVLIGMSCSGQSPNVIAALANAPPSIYRIGFSSFRSNNALRQLPLDAQFWAPADDYGSAQVSHLLTLHAVLDLAAAGKGDGG